MKAKTNISTIPAVEFSTPDLNLSAFLLASGQTVLRIERDGRRCFFVFDGSGGKCAELERSFWSGTGKVSARSYSDAMKNLKTRIFSVSGGRTEG